MRKNLKKLIQKLLQIFLIFTLITGWLFSGWPQAFDFPPEIQEVRAAYPVVESGYTSNASVGNASSLTLTKPSGVQTNDLLLILVGNDNSTATAQWDDATYKPTGFTLINEVGNATSDSHAAAFYRVADGTEGTTIDVTAQSANDYWGFYIRVSGVDFNNPINAIGADVIASASPINITGVNTTVAETLAFYLQCFDGADGDPFTPSDTGWSKTADIESGTGGTNAGGSWGTKQQASTGATGTVTVTGSVSDGMGGFQFAVAPLTGATVTIGTSGSQIANLTKGDTDEHIGGTFTATATGGTATITLVTITEQGTVNGQTGLDNIELWYDLDTTSPYDCASVSYSGDETQYGSTDTDGFSGPNGTSAFSGSVNVSGTQAVCFYVVLDVTSSAGGGETIEIEINSSGDVSVTGGYIEGSFPVQISGTTTIRAGSGTIMSTEVDFDWVPNQTSWGTAAFSTTETNGDVKLKVYYTVSTACDTIVSDAVLSGNSSGFDVSASPIDISGLTPVATTYNKICLQATLTDAGGTPYLNDWTVSWTTEVNQAPTVDSVSISPSPITLNADSTKTVTITATITDNDGCEDVFTSGSITAVFFDDAVESDTCTQDDNDCYTSLTLTEVDDTCTGAGDYTADASVDVSVWFIANPSSSWTAKVTATDAASDSGSNTQTVTINTLNAFKLDISNIPYGTVNPNEVSSQQAVLITTTGNAAVDVQLSGTNLTWNGNTIDVGQQKYSANTGFDWETAGTALTDTATCHELSTGKPTEHPSVETEYVYWKLKVPEGKPAGGPYSGTNYFDVVSEASCP